MTGDDSRQLGSPSACTLQNVHVQLGSEHVLRGVTAYAPAGQVTALLGPSGCGKTTLLRAVAGFERITAGQVTVGERIVDGPTFVRAARRQIGFVPQDGGLFPHLDVASNVAFGLTRKTRRTRPGRVRDLLDLVGITALAHRRPHELSGGQQQRVALARALAVAPKLVLLDEPFSALDVSLRTQVRSDVLGLLARTGTSTLLVTHDQDEALSCADHLLLMRHGRIVQTGTPSAVFASPVDAGAAEFLGAGLLLPAMATTDRHGAVCALGTLAVEPPSDPLLPGQPGQLFLRHDQLHLTTEPTHSAAAPPAHVHTAATVQMRVDTVSFHGVWTAVRLSPLTASEREHTRAEVIMEVRGPAATVLPAGSLVTLHVDGPGRWLH